MIFDSKRSIAGLVLCCIGILMATGCGRHRIHEPLGTISDPIWMQQEVSADASDFVVYQHEFKLDGIRLNTAGEDHVKKIAERLYIGQQFPVVIERSNMSVDEESTYQYPVHPDPELDMHRREVIVTALEQLGIPNAEEIVVVGPATAQGLTGREATIAYQQSVRRGFGAGSFGNGFGGFGGFGGGFGGFGGGFGGF